ncbi:MAG: LamG-like jellyroll fold domain-containing protein [Candidatus Promineifilaceae bacterium]
MNRPLRLVVSRFLWLVCLVGLSVWGLTASTKPAAAAPSTITALQFDGTNDHVTFGSAPGLGTATFTLELWFYRTAAGLTTTTGTGGIANAIPLLTKGRGEAEASNVDMNYFLGIDGTTGFLVADFEEGATGASPGLNHPVSGVTPILNNNWYHAAATYDGTTWRLYLNGNLETSLVVGQPPRADSIQHAALASALTSTGVAAGRFAGIIDDARVWNVARTQAEIQANLGQELASAPGLIGRWGLNEGSGTLVGDSSGSGINGTATNGPVWVGGSPSVPFGNYALDFGGTNGYVTFGNPAKLHLATFTVETWFNRQGAGAATTTGTGGITNAIPLVTRGRGEAETALVDLNYFLGIDATTNTLAADFEEGAAGTTPSLNHPILGTTVIPANDNTWHHAAATYDGTTWRLYLDGVLENSLVVGEPPAAAGNQYAALGTGLTSTGVAAGFFDGLLDEARVWNYARTATEVQATINQQLTSGTGLVARWGLNEGFGRMAGDSLVPLVHGAITGANWSWGAGAPFNIVITPPLAPTTLTATATGTNQIDLAWSDNATNEANYELERSTTGAGGPFTLLIILGANTTSYSNTGLGFSTSYCYRVRAANGAGNSAYTPVACATTPPPGNNAIDFGGTNAYVTLGNPVALRLPQFTLELWFRRDGTGVAANTGAGGGMAVPLLTKGVAETDASNVDMNYFLGIRTSDNVLFADFEEGAAGTTPGLNHPIAGVTPIANGVWYHAAATYDGTTWRLYLNGNLEATLIVGQPVRADSIQHAAIGGALNSTGGTSGFSGYFDGIIDEARIWDSARSQATIVSTMNSQLSTPQAGLAGRWGLNEGTGTTTADSSGNAITGTITNANWVWAIGAPFNASPTAISLQNLGITVALPFWSMGAGLILTLFTLIGLRRFSHSAPKNK